MAIVYPLKLEEEIMPIIELKSREEHTNKAIVLKQLIYQSLEEYVLQLCAEGRLSTERAAHILNVSMYDIHHKARERGIRLTATPEQVEKSRMVRKKLLKRAG